MSAAVVSAPAAAPARPAPAKPRFTGTPEEQKRKAELLEALGGVVHGGYQIDMFGAKRGRCLQNPKCFRYMPGNTKVNGCAMKGMGAVTCQRCGYQNMDH